LPLIARPEVRTFHEEKALRDSRSVRRLDRSIGSLFQERTGIDIGARIR